MISCVEKIVRKRKKKSLMDRRGCVCNAKHQAVHGGYVKCRNGERMR